MPLSVLPQQAPGPLATVVPQGPVVVLPAQVQPPAAAHKRGPNPFLQHTGEAHGQPPLQSASGVAQQPGAAADLTQQQV